MPDQVGPCIYDENGVLVWAGAAMFDNRNTFDFRAVHSISDGPHLSFVVGLEFDGSDDGFGVVLNNKFEVAHQIPMRPDLGAFDIHEFNILDDGKTALSINYRSHTKVLEELGRPGEASYVLSGGFAQIDLPTGEITHVWDSFDQISVSESVHVGPDTPASPPPGWDYMHPNSIDVNEAGDYLMSMRFTNTIYLISPDGHIVWRLGGAHSDFTQDFTFSKQHDAKFIHSNGTHHTISLLNNASDEESNDEPVSSCLFVDVDSIAMTATVVRRYDRPDGALTRLRGNAQLLPNNNLLAGWSSAGYFTESSPEGDLLFSGAFASDRYSTYRAYKFDFTGRPANPPDLLSFVWGTDPDPVTSDLTTTIYVSWNGATDVVGWNFYARGAYNSERVFIGNTTKTDFETMYIAHGYLSWISAEPYDAEGNVLSESLIHRTAMPEHWESAGFIGASFGRLLPDDPETLYSHSDGSGGSDSASEAEADNGGVADPHMAGLAALVRDLQGTVQLILFLMVLLALGLLAAAVGGVYAFFRRGKGRYARVPGKEEEEEVPLGRM